MKAPSSDASEDEGADDFKLDYADFFSVLMYYGHMRKEDIMSSSRPFLYEIYKKWADRACENLGISSKEDKDEDETNEYELTEDDYPREFVRVSDRDRRESMNNILQNDEFVKAFPSLSNRYR